MGTYQQQSGMSGCNDPDFLLETGETLTFSLRSSELNVPAGSSVAFSLDDQSVALGVIVNQAVNSVNSIQTT